MKLQIFVKYFKSLRLFILIVLKQKKQIDLFVNCAELNYIIFIIASFIVDNGL